MPGDVPVAYILLMYCKTMPWLQGLNIYHSNTRRQAQKEELFFFLQRKHQSSSLFSQLTFMFVLAEQELLESLRYSCHRGKECVRIVTAGRAKLGVLQASRAFVGLA